MRTYHEDSGAHRLPPRPPRPRNRQATVHRIHPGRPTTTYVPEHEVQEREARAMLLGHTASVALLPHPFLKMLREGDPTEPVRVPIAGQDVTLVLAEPGGGVNPQAELDTWTTLVGAIQAVNSSIDDPDHPRIGDWVNADLPDQIAVATWDHHGRTIHAQGPHCTRKHRRIARGTRRPGWFASVLAIGFIPELTGRGLSVLTGQTASVAAGAVLVLGTGVASIPTTNPPPGGPGAGQLAGHPAVTVGAVQAVPPLQARRKHDKPHPEVSAATPPATTDPGQPATRAPHADPSPTGGTIVVHTPVATITATPPVPAPVPAPVTLDNPAPTGGSDTQPGDVVPQVNVSAHTAVGTLTLKLGG